MVRRSPADPERSGHPFRSRRTRLVHRQRHVWRLVVLTQGGPRGGARIHPGSTALDGAPYARRSRRTRLTRLESRGIVTVANLDSLEPRTVAVTGLRVGYLPGLIDQARAAVAGRPLLRRGLDRSTFREPMSRSMSIWRTAGRGVYLWGVRIGRTGALRAGSPATCRSSWGALDPDAEAEIFSRFWTWMTELKMPPWRCPKSFAAYCYSSAENNQMLRIADQGSSGPTVSEVATSSPVPIGSTSRPWSSPT